MTESLQLVAVVVVAAVVAIAVAAISHRRKRLRRAQAEAEGAFAAAIRGFRARPTAALTGLADTAENLDSDRLESLIGETHLYEIVNDHLPALSSDEAGRKALEDFFGRLGPRLVEHDAEATLAIVQELVASRPDDDDALQCGLSILRAMPPMPLRLSEGVYQSSLELLENHPRSESLKALVLDVGRWHLDRVHDAGGSSYYDERAIQNDILARTA
ncbi:MAG: hypothetical protein GY719_11680 [bacterium]|nr:hypothetical protein [bacterium]